MAQTVKNLPAMHETQVQSLDQKDLLEKEMATHSSILAWKSHGQRSHEHVGLRVTKKSVMTEQLTLQIKVILSRNCTCKKFIGYHNMVPNNTADPAFTNTK